MSLLLILLVVTGAAVWVVNSLSSRETRVLPPAPEAKAIESSERRAICLCEHGYNFHDLVNDTCAIDGCRCKRYVGPEPLPTVFAIEN